MERRSGDKMFLNDLVYWYQKKIGTYDKEQWEKTVERRIFGGFGNVPMRTAKLKTELIDVDLVRGSSFPKAKPKHGLSTVAWLASRRLFLLPFYRSWWIRRTSTGVFRLFLLLYCMQFFIVCLYFGVARAPDQPRMVSPAEVLMPVGMMFVLCLVHSQIVSTSSSGSRKAAAAVVAEAATRAKSRSRRSRHERSRTGKLRSRRNLRTNETRSSQDTGKESTRGGETRTEPWSAFSVRFAKSIDNPTTSEVGKVRLEVEGTVDDLRRGPIEDRTSDYGSPEASRSGIDRIASSPSQSPPPISPKLEASPPPPPPLPPPPAPAELLQEQPDENANGEINAAAAAADIVHQDDDGFESLNGNVSSDNDRAAVQPRPGTAPDPPQEQEPRNNDNSTVFEEPAERNGREDERSNERASWRATFPSTGISGTGSEIASNRRHLASSEASVQHDSGNPAPGDDRRHQRGVRDECESEEEGECEEATINHLTEATTSATEWMGVTSNSDVCSYSSDLEESDVPGGETNSNYADFVEHPFFWELEQTPSVPLGSSCTSSDRVSCTIWTRRDIKKVELSVLDISSAIISRVESMPEGMDYVYGGLVLALVLSLIPSIKRLSDDFGTESSGGSTLPSVLSGNSTGLNFLDVTQMRLENWSKSLSAIIDVAFGSTLWERTVVLTLAFEKLVLSFLLFFLLAVAERTFKQRLLYAKLFSHLTSSRRARKSDLPHFRLNKFRNIKTWLSVRAYLKRRGPQRSVDVIVSAVFIVTLLLLSFVSLELIRDLENLHSRYNVEALLWSFALGIYILRFMTLGTKINKKYRNLSTLITEQINLYLQMEQKPHKKDELMVANSVLKLAADLIKELESPFKISGLSANPYLYTITKVVLLSALSGVLSELLGFKLKLHKITIK